MKQDIRKLWSIVLLLGAAGCASEAEPDDSVKLPPGWETATRVESLKQEEAEAVGWEALSEWHVNGHERGVFFVWDEAHVRCDRPLEAFTRMGDGSIDVLLQPGPMTPNFPAKDLCLFQIWLDVPAPAGAYKFTLYTLNVDLNNQSSPEVTTAADVSVR